MVVDGVSIICISMYENFGKSFDLLTFDLYLMDFKVILYPKDFFALTYLGRLAEKNVSKIMMI